MQEKFVIESCIYRYQHEWYYARSDHAHNERKKKFMLHAWKKDEV